LPAILSEAYAREVLIIKERLLTRAPDPTQSLRLPAITSSRGNRPAKHFWCVFDRRTAADRLKSRAPELR
jgi:hypothetical protein